MTVRFLASLPQPTFDAKQVQQNEAKVAQHQSIQMYDLMEQAGAAAFTVLQQQWRQSQALLVICGKGNNGGDGYIIARLALKAGYEVQVLVLAKQSEIKGDALTALQLAEQSGVAIRFCADILSATSVVESSHADVIADCIFGIGFSGRLSQEMQQLIDAVNSHQSKKMSVDVPSGLSAETGVVNSVAIIADLTVSFIALKKGLFTGKAADHIGQFYLADLNLGQAFAEQVPTTVYLQTNNNLPKLPTRKSCAHKGDIGLVLAIGSNFGMPGAIRMSAEAALRCGVALVSVCCHQTNQQLISAGRPELMLAPSNAAELALFPKVAKAKAFILGPGLGQDEWAQQHFNLITGLDKPCVIDADALVLLSKSKICQNQQSTFNRVLTPHPGEAAKLLACSIEEIEQDRFSAVKNIAKKYQTICVLKGAGSLVSDGNTVWINTTGNSGMASGGMGDVLSGIIAALMVQMPDIYQAVRLAVFIHGQAADNIADKKGQRGMLASDLFPELQQLVN